MWLSALLLATAVPTDVVLQPMRYLALGDSYTIGESVPEDERWPMQLARRLRERGVAVENPAIVARTGWTTDELANAMNAAELREPLDLVSLLIGVNNQYRGGSARAYRNEFTALLDRAVGLAGGRAGRVFVVSIPDWGVTPFAASGGRDTRRIARELDRFNAIAREECSKRGVAFVDITPISRDPGANPDMLAADGLHPSGRQYALWAERALPVVEGLLDVAGEAAPTRIP